MDWNHIEFGSVAPYLAALLLIGGALAGSFMSPAVKTRLEIFALLPGVLIIEIVLAGDALIWEHSLFRGACFAALSLITGLWLLWRLRAHRQSKADPSRRR